METRYLILVHQRKRIGMGLRRICFKKSPIYTSQFLYHKSTVAEHKSHNTIFGYWHNPRPRWEPVVNLFKDHGIVIDFSKRGFVGEAKSKPFLKRIKHHFYKTFKLMIHYPELIYLHSKYKNASIDKPISITHE